MVIWDVGTDWIDILPRFARSTDQTKKALQQFKGTENVASFYCDGAPELKKATLELGIMNPTSTPASPETNGRAEAKVKKAKGSTRCAMIQSGFHVTIWEAAATYTGFAFCIVPRKRWSTDVEMTAYERRHHQPCEAKMIPFGAMVDFWKTAFPKNAPAPFEARKVPGLFLGWFVLPGGVWSGDYLVVEYAPFQEKPDMTYGHIRAFTHRIKEVDLYFTPEGKFKFPLGERKEALARLPPGMILKDGVGV